MERVFKWVEENNAFVKASLTQRIDDIKSVEDILSFRKWDEDYQPILEYRQYLRIVREYLVKTDDSSKRFIFRHLFNKGFLFFILHKDLNSLSIHLEPELWEMYPDLDGGDLQRLCSAVLFDIEEFYGQLYSLCQDCGYEMSDLMKGESNEDTSSMYEYFEYIEEAQRKEDTKKYKSLPRTHRIAALRMLLDYMGVSKSIDKTKIAVFVEAITGGNIEVKGKDSASYKNLTKEAKAVAKKYLSEIGINITKK